MSLPSAQTEIFKQRFCLLLCIVASSSSDGDASVRPLLHSSFFHCRGPHHNRRWELDRKIALPHLRGTRKQNRWTGGPPPSKLRVELGVGRKKNHLKSGPKRRFVMELPFFREIKSCATIQVPSIQWEKEEEVEEEKEEVPSAPVSDRQLIAQRKREKEERENKEPFKQQIKMLIYSLSPLPL